VIVALQRPARGSWPIGVKLRPEIERARRVSCATHRCRSCCGAETFRPVPASPPLTLGAPSTSLAIASSKRPAKGGKLIVFPEAFVGGYPKGLDFGARVGSRTAACRERRVNQPAVVHNLDGNERFRSIAACRTLPMV
jgi:hypothetical protein